MSIIGNIRTPATTEYFRRDLQASVAPAVSLAPSEVIVTLISIEANRVMEGRRYAPGVRRKRKMRRRELT